MPFSPNKEFKAEPRMFVRGEGMYLWTADGRNRWMLLSGLFCVAAGHCRPEIAEAVYQQLTTSTIRCRSRAAIRRVSSWRGGWPNSRRRARPGVFVCSGRNRSTAP